jgi:hypothetical protein
MIFTHYYHENERPLQLGIPDREWETDPARKYDIFIEAQVWENIK